MPGKTKALTSGEDIRKWANQHGMKPAVVEGTSSGGELGILRLENVDSSQSDADSLKRVSWEDWLQAFERNNLALLVRPEDNFNKLVSRD